MNYSRAYWTRFFHRMGKNLLRDAWYPTVSIGIAQAIISPESSFLDCLSAAAVLLGFIITAAIFCYVVGKGISLGSDD